MPGQSDVIIAYSMEEEPVQTLLSRCNNPELTEILRSIHLGGLGNKGFTVQLYQSDFDPNQLTDRAKSTLGLYEPIPEKLKGLELVNPSE